jgi:hypothetical protein
VNRLCTASGLGLAIAVIVVACGGGSTPPLSPAPTPTPPTPPAPSLLAISGVLTATNGGQPLAGATVTAGGASSAADASGRYSFSFPSGTILSGFTISGAGLLTRNGYFGNNGSRTVDLDAFMMSSFDQSYFRAIARNGFEGPTALQPLRRWTRAPMIYLRTIDDKGGSILPEVLQQVVTIVTNAIPQYSNGRFGVAGIEQGTGTRAGQAGWITIDWTRNAEDFCGFASVGREGGGVTLTYDQPGCSCGSQKIRPRTVKHELGHAMGLWHTGESADLMSGIGVTECDRNMTVRELRYLDYLYRRPVGNTDPDNDPSTAVVLKAAIVVN